MTRVLAKYERALKEHQLEHATYETLKGTATVDRLRFTKTIYWLIARHPDQGGYIMVRKDEDLIFPD